jgi:hypothetical protein
VDCSKAPELFSRLMSAVPANSGIHSSKSKKVLAVSIATNIQTFPRIKVI